MAVLEKIRTKFGIAASIIIAIGLLSFIIDPNELISAFNVMSSKYDVGSINGKRVSYTDFQEEVQEFTTINEMLTGSSAQSSETQKQVRDAAWQDLIYKYLFLKECAAAGVGVGEAEMVDLTSGSSISPLISQNPAFMDENGAFSRENFYSFLQSVDLDTSGSLRLYWNYIQNSILNQQYSEKYVSLFTAGGAEGPLVLAKTIEESNATTDIDFVMVPYSYQTDSTIKVSSDEIKQYYKGHKNLFRQSASRDIEYVVFEVVPSEEDILLANNSITALRDEFAQTDNVRSFLLKNSDLSYNDYWYKSGELTSAVASQVNDFVWGGSKETVSEVLENDNNFYVARVLETANVPDSVYVKHILLSSEDASLADSLLAVLGKKGANFSNLAAEFSVDTGSAADGVRGNIGWMTQTYMISGFESVITAPVGKPYIMKTQYGTHIVEVEKTSKPVVKKKVAVLCKQTVAGKATINDYYSKANRFATIAAGSYSNYKAAVDSMGVYSHRVNKMLQTAENLGSIDNTREVTRWVFDNKEGKVSPIITVDNNYFFVAVVKKAYKEGVAELEDVANTIQQTLYFQKMSEARTAEVAEKVEGLSSLEEIAEVLGTSISTRTGIAFNSLNSQSLDPALIGAVSVGKEGEISKPVTGAIGTYIFKVTGRDQGAFFTEDDAAARASQIAQYKAQVLLSVMIQDGDVKDNRAKFY